MLYNIGMRKKKTNSSHLTAEEPKKPSTVDVKKVESDFKSVLYYQAKQRDNLLGEFSSDGKYKLSDEKIIQELISIPKKFEEKVDNVVYASTKMDSFVLNFKIDLDISESYCNATLFLIEVEHGVEKDIKHTTELANVVEIYSPKFKDNVYKIWNVHIDSEVYSKNDFLYEYLHFQNEEFMFNRELTEILSQLYLVRMLKLLDNCGELGEKIKLDYKILVEKILNSDASITQDNTRLKRLLDSVIIKHKAFGKILAMEEGSAVLLGYSTPIMRVRDKTTTNVMEGQAKPKEEKKVEKKVEAPKKKAKSKGGSDGGKTYVMDWGKVLKFAPSGMDSMPKPAVAPQPTPQVKSETPVGLAQVEQVVIEETNINVEDLKNRPWAKDFSDEVLSTLSLEDIESLDEMVEIQQAYEEGMDIFGGEAHERKADIEIEEQETIEQIDSSMTTNINKNDNELHLN